MAARSKLNARTAVGSRISHVVFSQGKAGAGVVEQNHLSRTFRKRRVRNKHHAGFGTCNSCHVDFPGTHAYWKQTEAEYTVRQKADEGQRTTRRFHTKPSCSYGATTGIYTSNARHLVTVRSALTDLLDPFGGDEYRCVGIVPPDCCEQLARAQTTSNHFSKQRSEAFQFCLFFFRNKEAGQEYRS